MFGLLVGTILYVTQSDDAPPLLPSPLHIESVAIDDNSDLAADDDIGDDHHHMTNVATWTGMRPEWLSGTGLTLAGQIAGPIRSRRPDSRGPPDSDARRFPSCRRTLLAASLNLGSIPTHELERNPVS